VSLDPLLIVSIFDILSNESGGDYSVQKKKKIYIYIYIY